MSTTNTFRGTLHSLGKGVTNQRGATTRSITKIGQREIMNLSYSAYLGTYIDDAIGEDIELCTVRQRGCPVVIGARFADGSVRTDTGWLKSLLVVYVIVTLLTAGCATGVPALWLLVFVYVWLASKPVMGLLLARKFKPTVRPE
ncbi:hypothetical protein SAMN05216466_106185 [Paraburkholderia phenazinium]|uniref:Uncharacterized protein n=1 Tax=Paraburkholderia phenazinium TaxID=60549 RepID=A0A1G7YHU8_9BURK|nr:hypothetical protein [Paraburkholderia phenazinium]SDG95805.1 hypothetical protein SAMN05216466_106185 [Paraburkholderia phenazinium]